MSEGNIQKYKNFPLQQKHLKIVNNNKRYQKTPNIIIRTGKSEKLLKKVVPRNFGSVQQI